MAANDHSSQKSLAGPWPRRSGITHTFQPPRLACSSRTARRLAKVLLISLGILIVALLLAPWQQNVTASGRVLAFSPLSRTQTIEVPVKGRIHRFADGIQEGLRVRKGDFIAEIRDLDPELLVRLQTQLEARQRELQATQKIVTAYESQMQAFESVRYEVVSAADEYVKMAAQKQLAEQQRLEAALAAQNQEQANYERQLELEKDGLVSTLKLQVQERKLKEAVAKVEQAKSYVAAAANEIEAKRRERAAKEREATAKIESSTALVRKASADVAKLQKEILDLEVKLSQQQNQEVRAPMDGFILRIHRMPGSQMVKPGDPLLTLVPDTADRAAELWVDGNDAPLVTPGRHVRLQFEGWPAVQFGGWPSVAVGSFGGTVARVDATDDGKGNFRILVVPDKDDEPWPSGRFLRQGVQAHGWVLLDRVSLGFEVWRQLNGFPPVVDVKAGDKKKSGLQSAVKKAK